MRTDIDIDDQLLEDAMVATGLTTKKATVEEALRRLVVDHRRRDAIASLAGIGWEGAHYVSSRWRQCSGDGLAPIAARHYRTLRGKGVTVRKTIDLVVATFCIAHEHDLLHDDRDFPPFARHLKLRTL